MATIEVYVAATGEFSPEAINRSVEQFATGKVERDNRSFVPSTDEFSRNVQQWQKAIDVLAAKEGLPMHNGLIEMDFGQGRIDMRGLTASEQNAIIANKGCSPNGKSLAYMSLPQIKQELQENASLEGGSTFTLPSMKGMGE